MKIKFWLFAALFAAAGMSTSCKDDPENGTIEPPLPPLPESQQVNTWMDGIMKEYYLWNEEYKKLTLDFNADYKTFLSTALQGVKDQNNANAEDGYYNRNNEWEFYTYVDATPLGQATLKQTRAASQRFGLGILGYNLGQINNKLYFAVLGTVPGSPAEKANISRGTYISKVDGTAITEANYATLASKLFPAVGNTTPVKLEINTVSVEEGLDQYIVNKGGTVICTPAVFNNTPILFANAYQSKKNPDVTIAYIVYHSFEMDYDETLMNTFKSIKEGVAEQGREVTDLILDLRYNGGGYLFSSALMATLIVGPEYAGQLYCKTTFNKSRSETTPAGEYYIGKKEVPEGTYPLLEEALNHSFNLKRVYVLTMNGTASASELIINGLRGLDVEVRTIGETTNGKNVGMEISEKKIGSYNFEFAPVSLRLENAKGFHDYANGFEPDILVTNPDTDWLIGAYASSIDQLFGLAYTWIVDGEKPSLQLNTRANGSDYVSIGQPYMEQPRVFGTLTNARPE